MYGRQLLVGSHDGVHQAECPFPDGRRQSSNLAGAERRWDGHVLAIAAKYDRLAIAAGSDGLREMPLGVFRDGSAASKDDPPARAKINCTQCNWVWMHMYAGGPEPTGGLAQFDREDPMKRHAQLIFVKFESSTELFGENGFSWAQGDRICMLSKDRLLIVRFRDRHTRQDFSPLEARSESETDTLGDPIAAAVGVFGLAVEYDTKLRVVLSNGSTIELEPPARWRVFPRSNFYENHIHFIQDDHLEVAAFVQDAEVQQGTKLVGVPYRRPVRQSHRSKFIDDPDNVF